MKISKSKFTESINDVLVTYDTHYYQYIITSEAATTISLIRITLESLGYSIKPDRDWKVVRGPESSLYEISVSGTIDDRDTLVREIRSLGLNVILS